MPYRAYQRHANPIWTENLNLNSTMSEFPPVRDADVIAASVPDLAANVLGR